MGCAPALSVGGGLTNVGRAASAGRRPRVPQRGMALGQLPVSLVTRHLGDLRQGPRCQASLESAQPAQAPQPPRSSRGGDHLVRRWDGGRAGRRPPTGGGRLEGRGRHGDRLPARASPSLHAVRRARGRARLAALALLDRRGLSDRVSYAVRCSNKLYLLKPGYDPRYARYSPSNLLCHLVLQDGFHDGLAEYNFLGGEEPWKLEWTKDTRPHHWLFIFSDGLRARLLHYAKFHVVPRVKRMVFRNGR